MQAVAQLLAGMPVASPMEAFLNERIGAHSETYAAVESLCRQAIQDGWMCSEGQGDVRWGRVVEPGDAMGGFSVDVVSMRNAFGPHHSHPLGEVVLIMPQTPAARFDSKGQGWLVYPPGSAHYPTVTGGHALVLYLLPQGRISFTK